MRQATLNVLAVAAGGCLGLWILLQVQRENCILKITGESVTLSNCPLTAELLQAITKIKPLKLDL
ncbi:triple block protein 3 [Potato virus P]|uniref:Movement protein TGBp3 n=2 Tax=Potato virus P TaxID=329164 RepID=Q3HM16_9VIRU|nr:triple block protein 3 [Potato virus P]ABA60783.1 triple block protein 3 [Potato rough dwarf virus]ABD23962.1 triple gene block protein 3 [Potato virus P]ABG21367.1 7 kDa [Potato rough dwarf virus]CAJ98530.1 7K protein [Potato rough dwarf virus]